MTGFHISIDNKFDELISKMKDKELEISDICELKTFITYTYDNENNIENNELSDAYEKINLDEFITRYQD